MFSFSGILLADGTDISITVTDASAVYESNGPLTFTIQLSESPLLNSVTVEYTTVGITAKADEDYTPQSGSVVFYPLQSSKTIEVPILNDELYEPSEFLYLTISNNDTGYEVTDDSGTGYIHDDDVLPLEAEILDSAEYEEDSNWVLNAVVKLNQNAPNDVTLSYTTTDNTALDESDYIQSSGNITIAEGSQYGFIPITVVGDTLPENDEAFNVEISSITEGTITDDTGSVTIIDDDEIKVYMDSQDINEGNVGDSNQMAFKVYLEKEYPLDSSLTIHYETQDGSSTPSALSTSDYTAKSGDITFNKGDTETTVYVDITGDDEIEDNEFLQMNLSGSTSIVTTQSQALILNDDGEYPSLSFSSEEYSIVEGNSSQSDLEFTFTLSSPALEGSSFHYETYDDTAEDEREDNDYIYTHGDKVLEENTTSFTIVVPINGDTRIEEDESFYFTFSNLEKLNYGTTNRATGTILNDDGDYPTLSFTADSFSIDEGNSSQKDINFTLSLDLPALEDSYFEYYTSDGTALNGEDYEAVEKTTFAIPEGEQNITIPIKINGDTSIEDDESFYLIIEDTSDNLKVTGTQNPAGILINDDGSFPKIDIEEESYSTAEGNNSSHTIDIQLILDKPALEDTSIDYYTEDEEAEDASSSTEDNDYVALSGTVTVPKDSTSVVLQLTINEDTNIEPNEDFELFIENGKNLTIGRDSTLITILNDDEHDEEAFTCDEYMYLSSSVKRGSEVTGRMWLHRIDISQSPFRFEVMDDTGEEKLYNALAYNEKDDYIYALYYKELFKISRTGKVMSLGEISELPDFLETRQVYAGASYNGDYYVTGFGIDYDKIYKIKLSDDDEERSVEEINLSVAVSIKDFSFSPEGKYLYGIADGGKLTKIDVSSGEVTFIGDAHTGYEFDSSFSDKNGRFFANDSEGNGFFEFDLEDGTKRFLSDSQPADYNDGANCINAELVFTDYGDAPHDNGKYYGEAWHNIINGIYLGEKVDHDIESYANVDATGDDTNGTDDEDGVTLIDGTPLDGAYLEDNRTQALKVTLSKEAYLRIWLDLDIDGYFDNGHDLVYDDKLTAGEHTIEIVLPEGLTSNVVTYLRARVSSIPAMDYQGYLLDGEVEDYAVFFGDGIQGVRGAFNVQRSNSIFNAKDFALYTQIVGRDFNYHVVFYDENLNTEQELVKVPVKVDLIDANNPLNPPLYTEYYYFSESDPKSRIAVLDNVDLNNLPATKEALFRITYATNANGDIVQQECDTDYKTCFDTLMASSESSRTNDAQDKFAIRPESFYISLSDGDNERINSRHTNTSLRVASGYEYNLSMIATKYGGIEPSLGYNEDFNATFDFNSTGLTSCKDTSPIVQSISYTNGLDNIPNFKHNNVGLYRLTQVSDENWTNIDKASNDCIENDASTSADGDNLSGCNIQLQTHPIDLEFYPDHFNLDLNMSNLPSSGHPDFIYMSEMNSTYSDVAISFKGDIIAQSEDNTPTTNFTQGCVATNLLLDLNSTTVSVEGVNQDIKTIKGTNVDFSRVIHFNSTSSTPSLEVNQTLRRIDNLISVNRDKFLDENNGTLSLDMRYNLNKHLTEPINPVQVSFYGLAVSSTEANSTAHDPININSTIHIPTGEKLFITDNQKNFYFARVVSDLNSYPTVNLNISSLVRTPLNVDIFCKTTINDYCLNRGIMNNTNLTGTTREQGGWYLSTNHHPTLDGNVSNLQASPNIVTILPNPLNPISLTNGENGLVSETFINCSSPQSIITITTSPALSFEPSEYIVHCTDQNASQWTGVGSTGNILNVKPKVNQTGKMDW
jgi:hypothetical protein